MKTRNLLSFTLILAALSFIAQLKAYDDFALGLAAATLLASVGSLALEFRSAKRQTESLAAETLRLETGQAQLKTLNSERDKTISELEAALRRAQDSHSKLRLDHEQLLARSQTAEATLQALRSEKLQTELAATQDVSDTAVLHFLRKLQERGRLLDFAMADIHRLPDAQVGAAARVVQQGVKAVLSDYFEIKPIREENEGSLVPIPDDTQDLLRFRILGDDSLAGPSKQGRLLHKGWEALTIRLPQAMPQAANTARILAPAEVEMRNS